jgi:hypothetical protein
MMLTINELSKKTGVSSYEIRRRVHNGSCPHTRVGAKQTKILIDEETFNQMLSNESLSNMVITHKGVVLENDHDDNFGYSGLRKID